MFAYQVHHIRSTCIGVVGNSNARLALYEGEIANIYSAMMKFNSIVKLKIKGKSSWPYWYLCKKYRDEIY